MLLIISQSEEEEIFVINTHLPSLKYLGCCLINKTFPQSAVINTGTQWNHEKAQNACKIV